MERIGAIAVMMLVGLLYLSWMIFVTSGSGCFSSRCVTRAMRVRGSRIICKLKFERIASIACSGVTSFMRNAGTRYGDVAGRPSGVFVLVTPPMSLGSKRTLMSAWRARILIRSTRSVSSKASCATSEAPPPGARDASGAGVGVGDGVTTTGAAAGASAGKGRMGGGPESGGGGVWAATPTSVRTSASAGRMMIFMANRV